MAIVKVLKYYPNCGRQMNILLGTLFALVVADGLITESLIINGYAWESNPFLQALVGGSVFLPLKIAGAFIAVIIMKDISKKYYKLSMSCVCFFAAIYTTIVYWNLYLHIFYH